MLYESIKQTKFSQIMVKPTFYITGARILYIEDNYKQYASKYILYQQMVIISLAKSGAI